MKISIPSLFFVSSARASWQSPGGPRTYVHRQSRIVSGPRRKCDSSWQWSSRTVLSGWPVSTQSRSLSRRSRIDRAINSHGRVSVFGELSWGELKRQWSGDDRELWIGIERSFLQRSKSAPAGIGNLSPRLRPLASSARERKLTGEALYAAELEIRAALRQPRSLELFAKVRGRGFGRPAELTIVSIESSRAKERKCRGPVGRYKHRYWSWYWNWKFFFSPLFLARCTSIEIRSSRAIRPLADKMLLETGGHLGGYVGSNEVSNISRTKRVPRDPDSVVLSFRALGVKLRVDLIIANTTADDAEIGRAGCSEIGMHRVAHIPRDPVFRDPRYKTKNELVWSAN